MSVRKAFCPQMNADGRRLKSEKEENSEIWLPMKMNAVFAVRV